MTNEEIEKLKKDNFDKYETIRKSAWEEYQKAVEIEYKKYQEIEKPAYQEYVKRVREIETLNK